MNCTKIIIMHERYFSSPVTGKPLYLKAKEDGILDDRIASIDGLASPCVLCPHRCRADRTAGEKGFCRAPYGLQLSSAFAHRGEEEELVGQNGSGTIFLTFCNLQCAFCQNDDISIDGEGDLYSYERTADLMVHLQSLGCHNINFVTPTHYVPQILKALSRAADKGLSVPIVYNCGGYESLEVVRLLDGIVDIYMPDIKFLDRNLAQRFLGAPDYPEVVTGVVREMQRQVGDLIVDDEGLAVRGLLIRHLVMPSCLSDTEAILRFIRNDVSENAYVNIMGQYHPSHRSRDFEEINVRLGRSEYSRALEYARRIGLTRAFNH
jgi:putative pyruvate formate lyase activating enzyme